jgi:hypothetical protein
MDTSNPSKITTDPNLPAQGTTPPETDQVRDHDVQTGSGGDPSPLEQSSVSAIQLSKRTTQVATQVLKRSESLGFMGLFRAVLDRIFNSSTKSWDQARINVAAKDYLEANPNDAEQISQAMAEGILRMDLRVAQAFVGALMECRLDSFKTFYSKVMDQINEVIDQGSKEPASVSQDKIKNAATLVDLVTPFLTEGQQIPSPALALCALVQKFPGNEITPDLIALCKNFPDEALALAKRQDCKITTFTATNDKDDGLLLMYMDRGYNPEIFDFITQDLFEEGPDRDAAIQNFLASAEFKSNLVFKDGIQRQGIPHITLPNGKEILSNRGSENSEYCRGTEKPYDQAEYLKYMLDKFKAAYGTTDEAIKAFKVFVQNFTSCGNTLGAIGEKIVHSGAENVLLAIRAMILLDTFLGKENYVHAMQMDKDFGIRLNITVCTSKEEEIETFNQPIPQYRIRKDDMLALTVSSYIPAVINDTMDQRGQEGTQTTHYSLMYTF